MKPKFKVGNRVRLKATELGVDGLYANKIYNISRPASEYGCVRVKENTEPWSESRFELVDTELERLVRRANSGQKALSKMLKKYPDAYEYKTTSLRSNWVTKFYHGRTEFMFRIKPTLPEKPKFITERLFVGPKQEDGEGQWAVTVSDEGTEVIIGCTSFYTLPLINSLEALVEGTQSEAGDLRATREGVRYSGSHNVTWADAELLLARLRLAVRTEGNDKDNGK